MYIFVYKFICYSVVVDCVFWMLELTVFSETTSGFYFNHHQQYKKTADVHLPNTAWSNLGGFAILSLRVRNSVDFFFYTLS